MTPWQLAKDSEHSHQRALFAWANCAARHGFEIANSPDGYEHNSRGRLLRGLHTFGQVKPVPALEFMFAIPNGGLRDRVTAAKLKAEGVKPGVPDVFLPISGPSFEHCAPDQWYYGLFIEMKKPAQKPKHSGAGGVAVKQSEYHRFLIEQGYRVVVCYSWQEAAQAIQGYLDGR